MHQQVVVDERWDRGGSACLGNPQRLAQKDERLQIAVVIEAVGLQLKLVGLGRTHAPTARALPCESWSRREGLRGSLRRLLVASCK
jgi:hypothetical protein